MMRTMLKSKIHRATVTQADLHYVGSVTVDEDLLDAADLIPGEQVAIVDVTNGARLETYVITGPAGAAWVPARRRAGEAAGGTGAPAASVPGRNIDVVGAASGTWVGSVPRSSTRFASSTNTTRGW